jgi:hypothetical protein
MKYLELLILMLCLCIAMAARAATCAAEGVAQSGVQVISITELYTSEGCNSCPPADKWFSRFMPVASVEQPHIPLAFHVDYWDYIGWTDKFANAKFSDRQRRLVNAAGKRTVYTPQVFLNGNDVGIWSSANAITRALGAVQQKKPSINMALHWQHQSDASLSLKLTVAVHESTMPNNMSVYFAIVEQNLSSFVNAGENKNVELQHAHTVRQFIGPFALTRAAQSSTKGSAKDYEISERLILGKNWKRADLSVVAFVEHRNTGEHLQALSALLCTK